MTPAQYDAHEARKAMKVMHSDSDMKLFTIFFFFRILKI